MAKEGYFSFKITDGDREHARVIASALGVDVTEWGKMAEVVRFALRLVALGFVTIPKVELGTQPSAVADLVAAARDALRSLDYQATQENVERRHNETLRAALAPFVEDSEQ